MTRRPPRSTRTDTLFPSRRSSDLATGLTRAGARRVLLTLRSLGYVSSDDKYFRLEPRVLELGYSYLASQPWWRVAQTVAERLAEELDTPVAAGVIDHDFVTYLAHARPRRFEAFVRSIGPKLPIGVSAMGRSEERRVGKECVSTCRS